MIDEERVWGMQRQWNCVPPCFRVYSEFPVPVAVTDSVELMYAWPKTACLLSTLLQYFVSFTLNPLLPSLSLLWLICACVRPNTDGFMTGWFLAIPWLSLSTCLLHGGVGSASAGQLFAFLISSAIAGCSAPQNYQWTDPLLLFNHFYLGTPDTVKRAFMLYL